MQLHDAKSKPTARLWFGCIFTLFGGYYVYLLRAFIGSLHWLRCVLRLAISAIALVFVLRRSNENLSLMTQIFAEPLFTVCVLTNIDRPRNEGQRVRERLECKRSKSFINSVNKGILIPKGGFMLTSLAALRSYRRKHVRYELTPDS